MNGFPEFERKKTISLSMLRLYRLEIKMRLETKEQSDVSTKMVFGDSINERNTCSK